MSLAKLVDLLGHDFMQQALLAALLTELAAPAIGTFLVQRRLALLGDGIGHVAVTGVALGLRPGPLHLDGGGGRDPGRRAHRGHPRAGHTNGDVALALLFYGGLAGGVLITGLAGEGRQPAGLPLRLGDEHQPQRGLVHRWAGRGGPDAHPGPAPAALRGGLRPRVRAGRRAARSASTTCSWRCWPR